VTLSKGDGAVTVDVRYGWDGVSTKETGCDGPLVQGTGGAANRWAIRVVNNDTATWYLHTVGKRGQPRNLPFAAGSTSTYTVAQAASAGYETASDIADITLTTSPT
jgi:hypothetical protein